ncbi:hypothetical protein EII40_08740 [Tannerella forsythia]|uniref:Uncharacterized protein n=1 Tax=Tannerella forsythia TaxID=28112 RepID=A0A3P1XNZ0_TANFO|nr:hypothetical protein EII40_08740 [Tannerella forsythia]
MDIQDYLALLNPVIRNCSLAVSQQLNNLTIQQFTASVGGIRAESPDYFSPIPQGWGIDIRTLFGGLKA